MLDIEIEEARKNGWKHVFRIDGGLIAPNTKQCKLCKALRECKELHGTCDYVVGSHRRNGPDGWNWAVLYK